MIKSIRGRIWITIMLIIEIRGKKGFKLLDYLLSWVPFIVFFIFDIADVFWYIEGSMYLKVGITLTILYQLVRFAIDFREQYKKAINICNDEVS